MDNLPKKTWAQHMCRIVDVKGTMSHQYSCIFLAYVCLAIFVVLRNKSTPLPTFANAFIFVGISLGMLEAIFSKPKKEKEPPVKND